MDVKCCGFFKEAQQSLPLSLYKCTRSMKASSCAGSFRASQGPPPSDALAAGSLAVSRAMDSIRRCLSPGSSPLPSGGFCHFILVPGRPQPCCLLDFPAPTVAAHRGPKASPNCLSLGTKSCGVDFEMIHSRYGHKTAPRPFKWLFFLNVRTQEPLAYTGQPAQM